MTDHTLPDLAAPPGGNPNRGVSGVPGAYRRASRADAGVWARTVVGTRPHDSRDRTPTENPQGWNW